MDYGSHSVLEQLSENRIFTADDVLAFARVTGASTAYTQPRRARAPCWRPQPLAVRSGDGNPLHADASFASSERFSAPVVHGMLYASMFGAIVGTRFPGAVYVSQTLNFRKPVYVGDSVTATLELRRSAGSGRLLDFDTRAINQDGDVVLDGEARVLLPRTMRLRPST